MKTIELNLTNIHSVRALHIYMQYMLGFPAYYGRNLDALHDMLCECAEALCLRVRRDAYPSQEIAAYLPRLERVLDDAAQENARLKIEWLE